jgi:hypothetical protein
MRLRSCVLAHSCWILLAVAIVTPAAAAQDIFVTPIPNAPFSGVVDVERSNVLPDGSIASYRTVREIDRDSRGRIHNEMRALVPTSESETPPVIRIHLYDPQTRISTLLIPQRRIFWTDTVNNPPSTVPPSPRFGSAIQQGLPQNDFTREEDLGVREFGGVVAHGFRETQTIPSENGTGKETVLTDEYWYSDELRINLMVKHSDPRQGTVTLTVTHVVRAEPDASAFEIPEGYTHATAGQQPNQ